MSLGFSGGIMFYDLIIIGAGAAGLFAGASLPALVNGLILEKGSAPGRKLLMTGGGQCNLTHAGSIKDFPAHYGKNGGLIRSILYRFNNQAVMRFFENNGVTIMEREDGKVFPESLQARDVVNVLVKNCEANGLEFVYDAAVTAISAEEGIWTVRCSERLFQTKKLIAAAGGCSYPTTGSNGSLFPLLENLGITIEPPRPALVPLYTKGYPYKELSGIAFTETRITIHTGGGQQSQKTAINSGALLFTHDCFSGPVILDSSRYAASGDTLAINYFPERSADSIIKDLNTILRGNQKQLLTVLCDYCNPDPAVSPSRFPKRFLEMVCRRGGADPAQKASRVSGAVLKKVVGLLTDDRHFISHLGGFNIAMATVGGVSLDEVDLKTMESIKYPGLFFAGEMLDTDGDTGGYNLQFAFSSGHLGALRTMPANAQNKAVGD